MTNIKNISTSALTKKMSILKSNLDEILISEGFIEKTDNGFNLTKEVEE